MILKLKLFCFYYLYKFSYADKMFSWKKDKKLKIDISVWEIWFLHYKNNSKNSERKKIHFIVVAFFSFENVLDSEIFVDKKYFLESFSTRKRLMCTFVH